MASKEVKIGYIGKIYPDHHGFIVKMHDLPGCLAWGRTEEDAIAQAESAIMEWIDEAIELKRPVPTMQNVG